MLSEEIGGVPVTYLLSKLRRWLVQDLRQTLQLIAGKADPKVLGAVRVRSPPIGQLLPKPIHMKDLKEPHLKAIHWPVTTKSIVIEKRHTRRENPLIIF